MRVIFLAIALGLSGSVQAVRSQTDLPHVVSDKVKDGTVYFSHQLATSAEHEVQCLWFLDHDPACGMVMNIDLSRAESYRVVDYFNWALQGRIDRKIEPSKIELVRQSLKALPQSDPNIDFAHGVHVAFWKDGAVVERVYASDHLPQELRKIYEVGGGKLPEEDK